MTPNKNILRLLAPLSTLYAQITTLRNTLYDHNYLKTHWLCAPTIAVGNITTGGTGKTPTVIFLANLLRDQGLVPGLIMRGYAAKPNHDPDELLLYRRLLPGVPAVANPNRVRAAQTVLNQGADVIIADDAFQHRRLGRDFNICLIDAVLPFGYDKILPAGHLREPLKGLARADLFILTRSDQVPAATLDEIRFKLETFAPNSPILTATHRPVSLSNLTNQKFPLSLLADKKILAFAAIGQPSAFFNTLKSLGATLLAEQVFRDHHHFTLNDLLALRDTAKSLHAHALVCTAKDLVKFTPDMLTQADLSPHSLLALDIAITMPPDQQNLLSTKLSTITKNFPRRILTLIK